MPPFADGLTKASPKGGNVFSLSSKKKRASEKEKPKPLKGILKKPAQQPPQNSPSAEEAKPLSNRERKRQERAKAWAAKIAEREAAEAAASPKKAAGEQMTDIEFLQRKRARQEAGSGGGNANQKKRRKEESFPLLDGAPAPRVFSPNSTSATESNDPGVNPMFLNKGKEKGATGNPGASQNSRADSARAAMPPPPKPVGPPQVHSAQLRRHALELEKSRQKLPIYPHADTLRQCLRDRHVLVMMGETGSGKSTQIGQFLVDEPWRAGRCIAITQPRKVAAVNLARRVAAEMGVRLGEEVGYNVRFDNRSSDKTIIKFLTDGMLLQEMLADPKLKRYSCVVVDEAHERTVGTDLVMGFLRKLVYGERRGSLKVVIMSATMEVKTMARFFEENRGEGVIIPGLMPEASKEESTPEAKEEESTPEFKEESVGSETRPTPPETDKKAKRKKKKKKKNKGGIDTMKLIRSPSPIPERIKTPEPTSAAGFEAERSGGKMFFPYFGTVALLIVPGRQYPVESLHAAAPVQDYIDISFRTVFQIHCTHPMPGDILVFLTGQDEIENLKKTILEHAAALTKEMPQMHVLPLYAALPFAQQNKVFLPAPQKNMRKVILCTNIAETSVTVPGVRYVVDCGKAKLKQFRPKLGLESLLVTPISQSSALQRRGRAGREGPGKCWHLYTEDAFNELAQVTKPEILRTDVSNAILILKARGHDDVVNFDYLSPPKLESLQKALEQLYSLGALGNDGKITPLGKKMAKLPLAPPLARVLLAAADKDMNCLPEVVDVVAALSVDNLLPPPPSEELREQMEEARQRFRRAEGDHIMLLELVRSFDSSGEKLKGWCEAHFVSHYAMKTFIDIRAQLRTYCSSLLSSTTWDSAAAETISPDLAERVLKAFLKGFFHQTARAGPEGRLGEYLTVLGHQNVNVHPASILFGKRKEAIVYHEYVFTTKPFARWCSAVQLDWVAEASPGWVKGEV
ncbi:ATP-dependent RNA helicase Prh1 [Sphaerosporella brunnea]|uniref:RNA helicase n=1 Tax=Sphaerosporella brunnea TaxID=1250544 RepID=A0A5J5F6D0_9PEZI|nr:ATP-dependent RNA helicase Prh1 [Sphaerosporella brunnea]